ncbi:MAG TPA: alpha/beta hydrolase [Mycobacteriales bacterium]|nr:alpha/beta hydrolase [Mycobacteriales bacterium]
MSTLDPQAQAVLDAAAASGLPPLYRLPIPQARARMRAAYVPDDSEPIASVRDMAIPGPHGGIPVRIYHPAPGRRLPLILFFHGGGWTVHDLDTYDRLSRLLARRAGCALVSVDYRRAPEARYPAAVDDAYTALTWAGANSDVIAADPSRLCLAGDSAGATLATTAALLARDRRGPRVDLQVLFYPVTDYLDPPTTSYVERAAGYSLDYEFMAWAWQNYLPDRWSRHDPYLFPLAAEDLSGMPTTVLLTAEFDPLRDEGIRYAERLARAGVKVDHRHLENQMHGFALQTRTIDRARAAVESAGLAIHDVLAAAG